MGLDFTGDQITGDDSLRVTIHKDKVEHLGVLMHLDSTKADLSTQCRVGPKQELLAGLPFGIECSGNLGSPERTICQFSTVFTGKGNALGDALVDNGSADFSKTVDIRLAGAEVPSLDCVVKEAPDAVSIVLVILGGIDATLRGDGVGAAGTVVEAEGLHLIAELG